MLVMSPAREHAVNTESVDDYLKAIFHLSGDGKRRVSSGELAERLGVAPASVTNMIQKLAVAEPPFLDYERHGGVALVLRGRRRALEIVRHHRLIETFLFEVLNYPIDELHDEAERLEHFISESFERRIAARLGDPSTDPHGHCIPTFEGAMPACHRVSCACE
jgi:DtxR family Mn-dependent transcriptional regulator